MIPSLGRMAVLLELGFSLPRRRRSWLHTVRVGNQREMPSILCFFPQPRHSSVNLSLHFSAPCDVCFSLKTDCLATNCPLFVVKSWPCENFLPQHSLSQSYNHTCACMHTCTQSSGHSKSNIYMRKIPIPVHCPPLQYRHHHPCVTRFAQVGITKPPFLPKQCWI